MLGIGEVVSLALFFLGDHRECGVLRVATLLVHKEGEGRGEGRTQPTTALRHRLTEPDLTP